MHSAPSLPYQRHRATVVPPGRAEHPDKALREELVTLTGGQKHVAQAAEFWVFCADFNRHLQICPDAQLGLAEQLLLGVV
ncbi:hypothetical protein ACUOFC_15745, partial [Escherichia sp. TWPC-MK]